MDAGNGTFITGDTIDDIQNKIWENQRKDQIEDIYNKIGKSLPITKDQIFEVGEVIEIKGSRFKLETLDKSGRMILQLLPKEDVLK